MVRRVRQYLSSLKIVEDEGRLSEMSLNCEAAGMGVCSQERPPSLMWPEIFVATTYYQIHAFSSLSRQRPPL